MKVAHVVWFTLSFAFTFAGTTMLAGLAYALLIHGIGLLIFGPLALHIIDT